MEYFILLFVCISAALYKTEANGYCAAAQYKEEVEVVFGKNLTLLCNPPLNCSDTFGTAPPRNFVVEKDKCTPDNICYNVDNGQDVLSIFNATPNATGYATCRCVQGESNRAKLVHCFELIGICQMEIKTSNHQPRMYKSTRAVKHSTFDISLKEGGIVTFQCQESAAMTTNCSDLNLLSTSPFSFRATTSHHRCSIHCMVKDQCGVTMILHVEEVIAQTTPQMTTGYTTQEPTDPPRFITNKPKEQTTAQKTLHYTTQEPTDPPRAITNKPIEQTTAQKTFHYTTQEPTDPPRSITNKPKDTAIHSITPTLPARTTENFTPRDPEEPRSSTGEMYLDSVTTGEILNTALIHSPIMIPLIVIAILLLLMLVFGCWYYCLCRNFKALALTKRRMKSSRIPKDGTDGSDEACGMTSRIVAAGSQEEPMYSEVDQSKRDVHMNENKSVTKTAEASTNATLDESVEYDVAMEDKRDSTKVPSDADVTTQNEKLNDNYSKPGSTIAVQKASDVDLDVSVVYAVVDKSRKSTVK